MRLLEQCLAYSSHLIWVTCSGFHNDFLYGFTTLPSCVRLVWWASSLSLLPVHLRWIDGTLALTNKDAQVSFGTNLIPYISAELHCFSRMCFLHILFSHRPCYLSIFSFLSVWLTEIFPHLIFSNGDFCFTYWSNLLKITYYVLNQIN